MPLSSFAMQLPRIYVFHLVNISRIDSLDESFSSMQGAIGFELLMLETLIRSLPDFIPPVTLVSNVSLDTDAFSQSLRGKLNFLHFETDGSLPMYQRSLAQKYVVEKLNDKLFPVIFMDSDMIFLDFKLFWSNIVELYYSFDCPPSLALSHREHPFPASNFNGGLLIFFARQSSLNVLTQIVNTYSLFVDEMKNWWGDQILLNLLDLERIALAPIAIIPARKYNYSPSLFFKNTRLISLLLVCIQIIFSSPFLLHLKGPLKFLYRQRLFLIFLTHFYLSDEPS